MDPFIHIPSPVLLDLVKLLNDFTSLENLLKASPCVASLFDECSSEIVEAVGYSTMPSQIKHLVLTIAKIRAPTFPSSEAINFFTDCLETPKQTHPEKLRSLPTASLRDLVSVLANIQRLAYSTILGLHRRIMNTEFRCLRDPFTGINMPKRTIYVPRDAGPPSPVEEFRVMKALVRLQLFFDLVQKIPDTPWPVESGAPARALKDLQPHDFWNAVIHSEAEQMNAVNSYLQENTPGNPKHLLAALPTSPSKTMAIAWPPPTCDPIPESVIERLDESQEFGELGHMDGKVYISAYMMALFRTTSYAMEHENHQALILYRRLGLYIWSHRRMAGLGLASWPYKEGIPATQLTPQEMAFAWDSALRTHS